MINKTNESGTLLFPSLAGSLAVTLFLAFADKEYNLILACVVFITALFHFIALGGPLYYLISDKLKNFWMTPVVLGFTAGAIFPLLASGIKDVESVLTFGGSGAVGGWVAWLYWVKFESLDRSRIEF